jgi:hypothetical protein
MLQLCPYLAQWYVSELLFIICDNGEYRYFMRKFQWLSWKNVWSIFLLTSSCLKDDKHVERNLRPGNLSVTSKWSRIPAYPAINYFTITITDHSSIDLQNWKNSWRWLSSGMQNPYDGGSNLLWNVGQYLPDYTVLHSRRQSSSYSSPWEFQMSTSKNSICQFYAPNTFWYYTILTPTAPSCRVRDEASLGQGYDKSWIKRNIK